MTAATRILEFMQTSSIAEIAEKPAITPALNKDEDILTQVRKKLRSTWHMSGTCKMGLREDETAVLVSKFAVRGVDRLKVADLGVLLFLVNTHPVAAVYLVGVMAATVIGGHYESWSNRGNMSPTLDTPW
jgi:choline dehydrogenase-like flavoprotein